MTKASAPVYPDFAVYCQLEMLSCLTVPCCGRLVIFEPSKLPNVEALIRHAFPELTSKLPLPFCP